MNKRNLRKWKKLIGRTKEDKELDEKLRRGISFEELLLLHRRVRNRQIKKAKEADAE